jgi:hypothetical protein
LFEPAASARHLNDERGFRKSTSSCKFFSMVEAQRANGRFQDRDRGGALTAMGAKPPRTIARTRTAGFLRSEGSPEMRRTTGTGCLQPAD